MLKTFFTFTFLFFISFHVGSCSLNVHEKDDKEIDASVILKTIDKGENIIYLDKRISGELDFTKVNDKNLETAGGLRAFVNSSITFINCTFDGDVLAYNTMNQDKLELFIVTSFSRNVSFIKCNFNGKVNFRDAEIHGAANFSQSIFYKIAHFEGTGFYNKNNYFTEAVFKDQARFQRVHFTSDVQFFKTEFSNKTFFQQAHFGGNVQFSVTKHNDLLNFSDCRILGDFLMNYAKPDSCRVIIRHSHFFGRFEIIENTYNIMPAIDQIHVFGKSSFSKSVFPDSLQFEDMFFLHTKPDTTGVKYKN